MQVDELVNYLITNTYNKLTYIKVRQPDPIAEIKAILMSDSIGQHNLMLGGKKATQSHPLKCANTCNSKPAKVACCSQA